MKNFNLSIIIILLFSELCFGQLTTAEFQIAVKMNTYGDSNLFLEHVTELQKKYPKDAKVVFLYGAYQYKIGNIENARKIFGKAIDLDPTFTYPYVARATIYAQKPDLESAIADMSTAIYWEPRNIQARQIRSEYCMQMKQYDLALTDIDAKIGLEPINMDNYVMAANVCMLQQNSQKAEGYYAKAYAAKNINMASVGVVYARYLNSLQRFNDVITRYNEAIKLDAMKMEGLDYSNMAVAYMRMGDFKSAILHATKAEKMSPSNLDIKCNTASIYVAKAEWKKAKKCAEQILQIDQKHKQGNTIMSVVEMHLGNMMASKIFGLRAEN